MNIVLYIITLLLALLSGTVVYLIYIGYNNQRRHEEKMAPIYKGVTQLVNSTVRARKVMVSPDMLYEQTGTLFDNMMNKLIARFMWLWKGAGKLSLHLPHMEQFIKSETLVRWVVEYLNNPDKVNIGSGVFNKVKAGWNEGEYNLTNYLELEKKLNRDKLLLFFQVGDELHKINLGASVEFVPGVTTFDEVWTKLLPNVTHYEAEGYNTMVITDMYVHFITVSSSGK